MRVLSCIAVVLFLMSSAMAQEPPATFSSAKKFLADLHEEIGHLKTIYCGCPYTRTTASGGDVDRDACGLEARSNETRSDRVEWEHVVPASWFGQTRACWKLRKKAYPAECNNLSGRKCCEKVNDSFDLAHNDPNNLFPSSGEVNADRSNHPYGDVSGEDREYGECDFEMGEAANGKVAEPGAGKLRGPLARAMLYMGQVYGVDVKLPLETVWQWHQDNPPEAWEIRRAKLIAERTSLRNEWVLGKE